MQQGGRRAEGGGAGRAYRRPILEDFGVAALNRANGRKGETDEKKKMQRA